MVFVVEEEGGSSVEVEGVEIEERQPHTLRLLQHPFHRARAPAAAHGDVEMVVVGRLGGCGCHCLFGGMDGSVDVG